MPRFWFARVFGASTASGGSPPAAPTLAVADLANGTGALATISGGDSLAVNTIYAQPFSGELGAGVWSPIGSRVGDGNLTLSLAVGFWWVRCQAVTAGGAAESNLVYLRVTSGVEAVMERILLAVQARVRSLALDGVDLNSILVRKVAWDRDLGAGATFSWPTIQISPLEQETMSPKAGTNLMDDVGYPVQVAMLSLDQQDQAAFRARYLKWREQIARAFRQQRLPGVPEVYSCAVEPNSIVDDAIWLRQQIWAGLLLLRFITREPRGFV